MQMSLFEDSAEKLSLYKAVDDIKNQFGVDAISKAVTSHLNEGSGHGTSRLNKKRDDGEKDETIRLVD